MALGLLSRSEPSTHTCSLRMRSQPRDQRRGSFDKACKQAGSATDLDTLAAASNNAAEDQQVETEIPLGGGDTVGRDRRQSSLVASERTGATASVGVGNQRVPKMMRERARKANGRPFDWASTSLVELCTLRHRRAWPEPALCRRLAPLSAAIACPSPSALTRPSLPPVSSSPSVRSPPTATATL